MVLEWFEFVYQCGVCWGYQFGVVYVGVGVLDGEYCQVVVFLQVDFEVGGLCLYLGDVFVVGGSIDYYLVVVFGQVDDQVVDYFVFFVEYCVVECFVGFVEMCYVVCQEMLQIGCGLFVGDVDYGYVGYVEDVVVMLNLMVFFDL